MLPAKNYEVVAELGHGAQGSVYLVREESSGELFAAKVVSHHNRLGASSSTQIIFQNRASGIIWKLI